MLIGAGALAGAAAGATAAGRARELRNATGDSLLTPGAKPDRI